MKYRHEWKHQITPEQKLILQQRLSAILERDIHTRNGSYRIRSLYFDNPADKVLREKLNGVNVREKFRIRYYNDDSSLIHLEKKSKVNGLCLKESAELTEKQASDLAEGEYGWMPESGVELITELYSKMISQGLRAKTIVDYTREAFVYAPGNVRVTIDYDIRTGFQATDFLNSECVMLPAGEAPTILEVKWDEFLPDIIRDVVQLPDCRAGAFSKYAACRIYG